MNKEVAEWFYIADSDYNSAKILNSAYKPNNEAIYWHCSQSIEKYLKGYLSYKNIKFEWNHNLESLLVKCRNIDASFESISDNCDIIGTVIKGIRYPQRTEINRNNAYFAIKTVGSVNELKPIIELRLAIEKKYGKNWQEILFSNSDDKQIKPIICKKYDDQNNELAYPSNEKLHLKSIEIILENIYKLQCEDKNGNNVFVLQRINNNNNEKFYFEDNFGNNNAVDYLKKHDSE